MADSCEISNTRDSESEEKSPIELSPAKRIKKEEEEEENINNESSSFLGLSPVEKALQNPLVLQNIFKFLSYKDLQTCQDVALPLWSSEAQHAISKRPLFNINVSKSEITMDKTFQGEKVRFKFQSITELSLNMQSPEKGHEIWLTVSELGLEDLAAFMENFKNSIAHLYLMNGSLDSRKSPSDLQKVLCELPNLSDLRLASIPFEWKRQLKKFGASISLPQVQTISFGNSNLDPNSNFYTQVLLSLFQIMPNLINVHRFPLRLLPMLKARDCQLNISSIKSVDIFNSTTTVVGTKLQEELFQLESISRKTSLQMAYLCLKIMSPKSSHELSSMKSCYKSLSRTLRNNQSTLEYLIIEPLFLPQFLEYPVEMTALRKIRLFSGRARNHVKPKVLKFFGDGFDARKAFPNLTEIQCEGTSCSLEEFLKFFPEDQNVAQNYFRGVTSLSLKFKLYEEDKTMEKVAALFPDLTHLFMDINIRWLRSHLTHIFRLWPKLTSLKFKLDVTKTKSCHGKTDKFLLDPVITGISAAKCNKLREYKKKRDINWIKYRENLGISAMTELEELILIFYGNGKRSRNVIPLFSQVAPFYGFQCLPDLKVTCAITWDNEESRIRKMLNPIKKYVIFNPSYY